MAANGLTPYMAANPYLSNVLQAFPSGAAAYSQDLPTILKNFSGQAVPIVSYPNWNPLGDFLNGGQTMTGFQGLGFPAQWGGATQAGTGGIGIGGATQTGANAGAGNLGTGTTGAGVNNGLSTLMSMLGLGGNTGTAAGLGQNAARTNTGLGTNANAGQANQVANLLLSLLG